MTTDTERFMPFAAEAVTSLGYIKPEFTALIAALLTLCEVHHPREVATKYRKRGDQLSRDEKCRGGIRANAFMSREAFDQLTGKGKASPLAAHYDTLLRAAFSNFRARTLASDLSALPNATLAYSAADRACSVCSMLDGKAADRTSAVAFPPSDCQRAICNIMLRWKIDYFAGLK